MSTPIKNSKKLTKKDFYSLATEKKLYEAKRLLELTEKEINVNIGVAEIFYNSFLGSIRAVTCHLEAELSRLDKGRYIQEGHEWYKNKTKIFGNKKIAKFFVALRNEALKSCVIDSVSKLEPRDNSYAVVDFTIDWRNPELKKYEVDFKDVGILSLSWDYFNQIKNIVVDAKIKYGFKDIPPISFEGRSNYMRPNTKQRLIQDVKKTYDKLLK